MGSETRVVDVIGEFSLLLSPRQPLPGSARLSLSLPPSRPRERMSEEREERECLWAQKIGMSAPS